ncbi:MAG: hypothetical protein HY965_07885 [Ignavibacteriales bacterium]|nr:hypothetical protein [Ignavibacteriales bacterium]
MVFLCFLSFVIFLRLSELLLSKRNEKWLLQNQAVESGSKHFPLIVAMHVLFFISLLFEYSQQQFPAYNIQLLVFYFLLLIAKAWTIMSLGRYWSTKIYRIPNRPLIKTGPYKYFKHPNYAIVVAEIAVIPLAFYLYYTAITFTILNAMILFVRIKEENKALQQ